MKIAIGSDHAGYAMKEDIKLLLAKKGIEVIDCGPDTGELPAEYVPIAKNVGLQVQQSTADSGILICGTGIGKSRREPGTARAIL